MSSETGGFDEMIFIKFGLTSMVDIGIVVNVAIEHDTVLQLIKLVR